MEFSLLAHSDAPEVVAVRFAEFSESNQLPARVAFAADHALVEHVQNIVNFAAATRILISFSVLPGEFRMTVTDDGREFDPTRVVLPLQEVPPELKPIGGVGLQLIRKLMDRVEYTRIGGENCLEMSKRLALED